MRKLKDEAIERAADRMPQGRARSSMSIWRLGAWLPRMIRRSCAAGMWTISRDGKLGCEPLSSELGQPD